MSRETVIQILADNKGLRTLKRTSTCSPVPYNVVEYWDIDDKDWVTNEVWYDDFFFRDLDVKMDEIEGKGDPKVIREVKI